MTSPHEFEVTLVSGDTSVTSFVTPTGDTRVRTNIDARIAWEIVSDFVIGINVTERLDSRAPSATAIRRDYQYSSSVGRSWS